MSPHPAPLRPPTPPGDAFPRSDFAKPPPRTDNSPAAKRLKLDSRRVSPFQSSGGNSDEEAEPMQLNAPSSSVRRSQILERRTATRNLATSFDEDNDQRHQGHRGKNKRPLMGPPTAKNKVRQQVPSDSESDSDQGKNDPPSNPKNKSKLSAKKTDPEKATVVSSDSDLDDDELGITPRTPPQSPFYRGPQRRIATVSVCRNNICCTYA